MADSFSNRSLTAFFDNRDDAEDAVSRLRTLGISDASVRITGGDQYRSGGTTHDKGFWDSVADFFFPEDDRETYAEGLRRGGYLVTASNIPSSYYDQALDILDDEGSVDIDQRAETWRSEGWTGSGSGLGGASGFGGASSAGLGSESYVGSGSSGLAASGAATGGVGGRSSSASTFGTEPTGSYGTSGSLDEDTWKTASSSGTSDIGTSASAYGRDRDRDEEVIPVVQEELRVGKRDVNLGRVRVRSYVVEEPVSEQVSLRQDRVEIERRPANRALSGDEGVFTDRTLEAEEHAEEAVVAKEARVTEEIALRRQSEERTETVSDTIRHTEVEVEDDRDITRTSDTMRRA